MRSSIPFHGVPAPVGRKLCRTLFAGLDLPDAESWETTTRYLWAHAKFREERYATITLARSRAASAFQRPAAIPLYGEMIASGAWWDYVDEIAVQCVGPILRDEPARVAPQLRAWSRSDDLWLRRASIIAQVGSKRDTDAGFLSACIEPSLGSREFFLRKAIGWALRQYARVEPNWVQRYVDFHADRLSPLSRREATQHLA